MTCSDLCFKKVLATGLRIDYRGPRTGAGRPMRSIAITNVGGEVVETSVGVVENGTGADRFLKVEPVELPDSHEFEV